MKRALCIAIFTAGLAMPAAAADMPARVPVKAQAVAPLFNWTGFYAGINGGYGWDPGYVISSPGEPDEVLPLEPRGAFGGGQFGYNWQFVQNWLYGVEVDFQFADIKDSVIFTAGGGGTNASTATLKLAQFATVRGRFGYLVNPTTLIFATGGVAFGNFRPSIFAEYDADNGRLNARKWDTGFVVGGGFEHAFGNGWTFKVEYQYLDFSLRITGITDDGDPFILTGNPEVHTVRFGINRKFGAPPPP